jgi:hypothetical protein
MPVRRLGANSPAPNLRTGILWVRDWIIDIGIGSSCEIFVDQWLYTSCNNKPAIGQHLTCERAYFGLRDKGYAYGYARQATFLKKR